MPDPNLDTLKNLPVDDNGPVFREPWEARAFALALGLHEQGVFDWNEWADALGETIAQAQGAGDADRGDTYYRHWLACLESLVLRKGLASVDILAREKQAADDAHRRVHHNHQHDHEPNVQALEER